MAPIRPPRRPAGPRDQTLSSLAASRLLKVKVALPAALAGWAFAFCGKRQSRRAATFSEQLRFESDHPDTTSPVSANC